MKKDILLLLRYVEGWKRKLFVNSCCTVVVIVLDITPQLFFGLLADLVSSKENAKLSALGLKGFWVQLVVLSGGVLLVFTLQALFGYISKRVWNAFAQELQHTMRTVAYGHLQTLELAWYKSRNSGALLSVLTSDVNRLQSFFFKGVREAIEVVVTLVFTTLICFFLSVRIALCMLCTIPLVLLANRFLQRAIYGAYMAARKKLGQLNGKLNTFLQGVTVVKTYGLEERAYREVEDLSAAYQQEINRARNISFAIHPMIRVLLLPMYILMLVGGGWLVMKGQLATAAYVSLILLIPEIEWPIRFLGSITDAYEETSASAKRVAFLMEMVPQLKEAKSPKVLKEVKGEMALEGVSFGYKKGEAVLEEISLRVGAGQYVGLVGPTGGGKSTLLRLMLRLYDPSAGVVKLDGHDVRTLDRKQLEASIGLVSQSPYLFAGSIRDNLLLGVKGKEVTTAQLEEVVEKAGLKDFMESLPRRFETEVGENGLTLSQGQRQRLCIARALLKKPKILIFDEATSAVDHITEQVIQSSLLSLKGLHTIVVVAHRLSTVRFSDQIYVVGQKRIMEAGSHADLLKKGGVYHHLWAIQRGEGRRNELEAK